MGGSVDGREAGRPSTSVGPRTHRAARLTLLVVTLGLSLAAMADAATKPPSTTGAKHAAERAIREEGREPEFTRCRHLSSSAFTCTFFARYYRNGRVRVTYTHGHYNVGEPRYEAPPPYQPVPKVGEAFAAPLASAKAAP